MKFYLRVDEGFVIVRARVETEDEDVEGDFHQHVHPGEEFLGHSFEQLVELGSGKHEIVEPEE